MAGTLELCPIGGVDLQFGPSGFRSQTLSAGASGGSPIPTTGHVQIILTGSLQAAYQHFGFHDDTQFGTGYQRADLSAGGTNHEWFGILTAGVGLVFKNRFSLVPQLRVPFGYEGSDLCFLIHGSVNIGKGK